MLWSQKSLSFDDIGIIFVNQDGTYTVEIRPIDTSCSLWWEDNLVISDRENHTKWENLYVHTIAGNEVIGYICNPTLTD